MVSEWASYRLGDITEWTSGGTPSKSNNNYWGGEIPWVSATSMDGNRYRDSKLKITALGLYNGSRLAPTGSILLLVRGSILHQKIQVGIAERDVAFNQDVKALRADENIVEPWFLLLWFMAKKQELLGLVENTGIGAGKLDTKVLQDLIVDVPPKGERARILTFAKALDDKIELNRQMNATLEAMAQALFNSWFVDFDPVIDNALAAGNPIPEPLQARAEARAALGDQRKPLPKAIQKQFPNSFVFNEDMGWVPVGWTVGTLLDQAELISGGTPKTSESTYWDGDIPWASAKDVSQCASAVLHHTDRNITDEGLVHSSTKRVGKYSTVIVSRGATTGRLAMVGDDFAMNQTCYALRSRAKTHFYQYCNTREVIAKLVNAAHGSVFDTITTTTFRSTRILLAPDVIAAQFDDLVATWFWKLHLNLEHSGTLEKERDTLLPKLLSGQLRIPEAEQQLAEAL